jgi:hypothetical protein
MDLADSADLLSPNIRILKNVRHHVDYVVDHFRSQAWVNAYEECASHDRIGLFQSSVHPVFNVQETRLAHNIAAKYEAGFDVCGFQLLYDHAAVDSVPNRNRKSKWRRIRARIDGGKDQVIV